jgi:His/Glu/Gln/Arg/opine family amino acid ABC transporter permease subunit
MATIAPTLTEPKRPPDTRGPALPLPAAVLAAGITSVALVIVGPLAIIAYYGFTPFEDLVFALRTDVTAVTLITGLLMGLAATAVGFSIYRRMPTRRTREHAIAGAVVGIQAILVAGVILFFRSGEVEIFSRNFLDFDQVIETIPRFIAVGMKNTVLLAFLAEAGGIVVGLVLAMMAISSHRSVRAPARIYINFFRGTPLIWQLPTAYFIVTLGFRVHVSAFTVGLVVFILNSGAYIAEIFRAGIQSIERGQLEAARSLGMSYLQAMRYAIVPQAVRRVIPPLMNEFVALVKDTALIIVLGLARNEFELLSVAQERYSETFNGTFYWGAAAGYLLITLPLIRVVNWLESKLRSGLVNVAGTTGA